MEPFLNSGFNTKVNHLMWANKVIRKLNKQNEGIIFPHIDDNDLQILVYSDASHANLPDESSSTTGYIIFLKGYNEKCCPLSWSSCKIKRVVKSTTAAECLALVEALEDALYLGALILETLKCSTKIPIVAYVGSKNLYSVINSTKCATEKRLHINIAFIKEMCKNCAN